VKGDFGKVITLVGLAVVVVWAVKQLNQPSAESASDALKTLAGKGAELAGKATSAALDTIGQLKKPDSAGALVLRNVPGSIPVFTGFSGAVN
jgi:hypothetical protein